MNSTRKFTTTKAEADVLVMCQMDRHPGCLQTAVAWASHGDRPFDVDRMYEYLGDEKSSFLAMTQMFCGSEPWREFVSMVTAAGKDVRAAWDALRRAQQTKSDGSRVNSIGLCRRFYAWRAKGCPVHVNQLLLKLRCAVTEFERCSMATGWRCDRHLSGHAERQGAEVEMKSGNSKHDDVVTGRRETDANGDEWFEVLTDDGLALIPCDPEKTYSRTGEWRGWCDYLGNDDIDEVCRGMTPEERARETDHIIKNGLEGGSRSGL
jgi:hypothetical protein